MSVSDRSPYLGVCTNPYGEGYSYQMQIAEESCRVEFCDCTPDVYVRLELHQDLRADLDALISDHDGMQAVWVCDRCGQPIGKGGRCNSGAHVGPGDADDGPASGHAVATTDLVAERDAAVDGQDRLLSRAELLYDDLQALMDACGHCAAAGHPPNEVMIDLAREALRASRTGDL